MEEGVYNKGSPDHPPHLSGFHEVCRVMLLASAEFRCFDKFAAVDRDRPRRVRHDLAEVVLQRFMSALRVCVCLPSFPHVVQHPGAGGQTL